MQEKKTLSKTRAVALINCLFNHIPRLDAGWGTVAEKLEDMNLSAERQHRAHRQAPKGFSANAAARYFTVSHLFEALENPTRYTVADILSIRNECLYAQAWAVKYAAELQEWRAIVKASEFHLVDYAELMSN